MRIDYSSHDLPYQRYRAAGRIGWDGGEAEYRERQVALQKILDHGRAPRTGKLLELGCGAGNMAIWLAKRGYEVSGIEIAPTAVEWAQENSKAAAVNIDITLGDACTLEAFSDNTFDFVLDGHCFHCIIGPDRPRFLAAARRVLKPGGYFLIDSMCGPNVDTNFFKGYDPASRCTIINGLATRYLGLPEDILAEVQTAGFQVLHTEIEQTNINSNLVIEAIKQG